MKDPFYKNSKSYLICGLIGVVGVLYLGLAIFVNSVTTVIDIDERNVDGLAIIDSVENALRDIARHGFKPWKIYPLLLVIILMLAVVIMLYFVIKDNFFNDNFRRLDKLASEEKPVPKGIVVNTVFGGEDEETKTAEATDAALDIDAILAETSGTAAEESEVGKETEEAPAEPEAESEFGDLEEKPYEITDTEITLEQKKALARRKRIKMGGPLGVFFRFEDKHKYISRIIPVIAVLLIYIALYHTRAYKDAYNTTTELVISWQSIIEQYKAANKPTDMVAEIHTGLGLILVIAGEIFYFGAFCFNFVLDTLNED